MHRKNIISRYKGFFKDSFLSIAALMTMNVMLQLLIYPVLRSISGVQEYGNMLFLVGIVNIISTSVGCSANNSRLKASTSNKDCSREYNLFLLAAFLLYLPAACLVLRSSQAGNTVSQVFWYWSLMCATTYRNYADVEYRLHVNYKGYFGYYLAVSAGYLIGIVVYFITHNWTHIFLTGELSAAAMAMLLHRKERTNKKRGRKLKLKQIFTSIAILMSSQLLVNTILNADRLILKLFVGASAVTVYYAASLLGKTAALITAPLNSVIIGYLARRSEDIRTGTFLKMCMLVFAGSLLLSAVSILGSHIFVAVFYPQEYGAAKAFFVSANTAQIFYFTTGIIMTILLRYMKEQYQFYINGCYCVVFLALAIPVTIRYGICGFSIALCCANLFRFILAAWVGIIALKRLKERGGKQNA